MSLPETCPFCGAGVALDRNMRPQRSDMRVVYECKTAIVDAHDRHRWQSDRCENAQKARAVDRVRELAARVAELERDLEQAKADRARAAMDARNPLLARVAEMEARCKRLEELGAELRVCAGYLGWTSSDDPDCITRAERACIAWDKEAKP